MKQNLDIYNIFDLLKHSYKHIDFRSAVYYNGYSWQRIISLIRFSNRSITSIKKEYDNLNLKKYITANFKIQHEILEVDKWEDKLVEIYAENHEDLEIYDIDEFYFDDAKYEEFQTSFISKFEARLSTQSFRAYFTEEEVKDYNLIHFNYYVANSNEHHNQVNKFLNNEVKAFGDANIYEILNRTLKLHEYGSQNSLFISIIFPIYMKISDLEYAKDVLSGKVQFQEIFEETKIFFRSYSNPNYNNNSYVAQEEIILLKDNPDTKVIDNGTYEKFVSIDFKKYDCDPIFEIRAFWDKVPQLYLIDFRKTFGIQRFQKLYEDLNEESIEGNEYIVDSPLDQRFSPDSEKKFINTDFKDYQLTEYNEFIELINISADIDKFRRILPILLRTLFENLLYDIFQTGLSTKHKNFFFSKDQNRARDFSQLIGLLNILKDNIFKLFHKDSINQKTIAEIKEIQKFGNWTVHEIFSQVDRDFVDKWKDKINIILIPFLTLYKKVKGRAIEITDQITLEKINKRLNLKQSIIQRESEFYNKQVIFNSQDVLISQKFKNLYNRLASRDPDHIIIDIKAIIEDIGEKNIEKILKMEYVTEGKERIMLIEPQRWNLSIRIGSSRHVRLIKYVNGNSVTYDFEFPNQNEEILNEFLNFIKDRCKKRGLNLY